MSNNFLKADKGRYKGFGGCYLPEGLMTPILELEKAYYHFINEKNFKETLRDLSLHYVGRPTALTEVKRFSEAVNGPRIFLKREDLLHTGAHKINNAMGQCLLAKMMGKTRVVAETGAGQHGVATATACAYFGLECIVYMGEVDIQRQMPNVQRMRLLGAQVMSVKNGSQTLKDAVNEALRNWSETFSTTHYCLGSALGPHPYPEMVAYFQAVIGKEAHKQCLEQTNTLPNLVVACVGGGSNAIGIFSGFIANKEVALVGVEAGGTDLSLGHHAARFQELRKGVLQGCYTYLLQNDAGRAKYVSVSDEQALAAFKLLSCTEGIIPALESSHALAYVMNIAHQYSKDQIILINLSGRGDKDLPQLIEKGLI